MRVLNVAQPEQENKNTTRPQRGTAGVSHSQGRERHSFTKSLASAARPPRLLLTSPPARQTPAVGAAARTGQDQGGGACPFRPPDPLRRGKALLQVFAASFSVGSFSRFSFLGERLGFLRERGRVWGEVLGFPEAILLDRFKCEQADGSAGVSGA